jgi:hypothetical protein
MFRVLCEVWGGITGSREADLKANGKVQEFETWEEADKVAQELMKKMNNPYAVAHFRYTAYEV